MASKSAAGHSKDMLDYCKLAVRVLEQITDKRQDAAYAGPPAGRMPTSALLACNSLAFFEAVKAGAGLSFSHGWGFVISRKPASTSSEPLVDPSGTHVDPQRFNAPYGEPQPPASSSASSWSAPCFLTLDEVGLGLTLGVSRVQTCMLLWNEAALQQILQGKGLLGTDVHLVAGSEAMRRLALSPTAPSEEYIKYPTANPSAQGASPAVSTYSTSAEGVMVDFSLSGGRIHVNQRANEGAYGPGVEPGEILGGSGNHVRDPAEFDPLYNWLQQHEGQSESGHTGVIRHVASSCL